MKTYKRQIKIFYVNNDYENFRIEAAEGETEYINVQC